MTSKAITEDPLGILDEYDFDLPEANIAQAPMPEREASRLLVLDRTSGRVLESKPSHCVRDLPQWLHSGDLLVVNATRVRSARLVGQKASGGAAEALLLGPETTPTAAPLDGSLESAGPQHRALVKCTGHLRVGLSFSFGPKLELKARLTEIHPRGEVSLRFETNSDPYAYGEAPLPPYIRRDGHGDTAEDLKRYQTIYARESGAIAAPTAGLHFTQALFDRLRQAGIGLAEVVLHVGAGTFRPLEASAFETGRLHPEDFSLPQSTVLAIEKAQASGGRVIAVGTTTARVLESQVQGDGRLRAGSGTTDLFIRPGGPPFRLLDGLLTNFHLPRSSLFLLVSEFVGRRPLLDAYAHAIQQGFRFYSYGDAMLVLPENKKSRQAEERS